MKITNKLNLPEPIVEAVKHDDYDKGDADISVSTLIGPSMIRHLKEKHDGEIERDAADMIYALTGKALHSVLDKANVSGISEKRLYTIVDDYTLSGQFDHMSLGSDNVLEDYKECSVWSVIYGNDLWEPQLNVYRYLCSKNGYEGINKLKVVAFLRDHQKSKAKYDPKYPPFRVHVIDIPLWPLEKTADYIKERLKVHFAAPPHCTDTERWKSEDKYAVMKTGRKSALRVLDSGIEARSWMSSNNKGSYVEVREGGYRRCGMDGYCDVWQHCPILKKEGHIT